MRRFDAYGRSAVTGLFWILLASRLCGCAVGEPDAGRPPRVAKGADDGGRLVSLPTGVALHVTESGEPSGEAVLLLHGITDTKRSFEGTIRHLSRLRADLRLLAVDLRGHGASGMPDPARCAPAPEACFRPVDFAADVLALMDELKIARAYLVGHSLGSLVAQEIALTRPDRVHRIVLIASGARMTESALVRDFLLAGLVEGPWRESLVARGLAFPRDVYDLTPLDADPGAERWLAANWVVEPAADPELLEAIAPETAQIRIGTWLGAARALLRFDNRERLRGLRVPALVLWPSQDTIFPESPDQRELLEALDSAARACLASSVWKQYGVRPLPPSGAQEGELGHNLHWGAPGEVAADLAAYLRDGGAPTRDLHHADPGDPSRVLTVPGEARLVEMHASDCPA